MSAQADDLRGQLEAAFKGESEAEVEEVEAVEAVEKAETAEQVQERARDEKGRFVAKQSDNDGVSELPEQQAGLPEEVPGGKSVTEDREAEPKEQEQALAPPNGWSADAKAKWHELPTEIQQAVNKREQDVAKFTSTRDEHASFGKSMYQTVQPYMAQIQAEGGTPETAIKSLLNTAYILRVGTAEQRRNVLLQTAQQFGVDLGVKPQGDSDIPPYIQPVIQRLNQLEGTFTQREQAERDRNQAEVNQEITAFAADPKHPHFNEVKVYMTALLKEGAAQSLQDAYDQACWARPDIRATLQAQQRAEEEQKRRAEAKARAEKARNLSGITGGPGNTAGNSAPENRSLRDELNANWAAQSGGV
jgi:hypothetical protein